MDFSKHKAEAAFNNWVTPLCELAKLLVTMVVMLSTFTNDIPKYAKKSLQDVPDKQEQRLLQV